MLLGTAIARVLRTIVKVDKAMNRMMVKNKDLKSDSSVESVLIELYAEDEVEGI